MSFIDFEGRQVKPGKILCVGRNYAAHIEELGNAMPDSMVVFHKPASSIDDTLYASHLGEPLHYEAEICFLIENGHYKAVAAGLDLTKRALQSELKGKGLPWERAKAFDGSALFSAFVELPEELSGPLKIELWVDGELRQSGTTQQMLYPPEMILGELAGYTRLEDGDLVMTGTPKGVGEIKSGQTFRIQVSAGQTPLVEQSWMAQ